MKIKNCRCCKSSNLKFTFSLGNQYLTGIFPKNKQHKISKGLLALVLCENCKLLQLQNSFNNFEMYGENYGYMSSLNKSMFTHLKYKVEKLKKRLSLKSNDTIIDIGSNDGTFLSFFPKNLNLIGIDPTISKFSKFYRKDIVKIPEFFSGDILQKSTHRNSAGTNRVRLHFRILDII